MSLRDATATHELLQWLLEEGELRFLDRATTVVARELLNAAGIEELGELSVMTAVKEMKAGGETKVEEFTRRMGEELQRYHALPMKKWRFLLPMAWDFGDVLERPARVRVLGQDFYFVRRSSVERVVGRRFAASRLERNRLTAPDEFVSAVVTGKLEQWAWRIVDPAFAAFRGLVELKTGFRSWHYAGRDKPRRKLAHPEWMFVRAQSCDPRFRWFEVDGDDVVGPRTGLLKLQRSDLDDLRQFCHVLRTPAPSGSTNALIADCLRLYSQALDTRFRHATFLGLWQTAEAIVGSFRTEDVARGLALIGRDLGLPATGIAFTTQELSAKRNEIVHHGIHDVDHDDLNILRTACDTALAWLFRNREAFPERRLIHRYLRSQARATT